MNRSKIEWTDLTWNVLTGCKNNCFYCYGAAIRRRFQPEMPWDTVLWHPDRLDDPIKRKKPAKIFVGSMTDLFAPWAEIGRVAGIVRVTRQCPRHTFQFLTKCPSGYDMYDFSNNCWLGVTVTSGAEPHRLNCLPTRRNLCYVSFEPLMGPFFGSLRDIDWVIIGAMTGPWANKYKPEAWWIREILKEADRHGVPVFLKDNLKPYWPHRLRRQWPKGWEDRG